MEDFEREALLQRLLQKIEHLGWTMERMNFAEYVALFENPRRLVLLNFVAGVSRGLGIAVGFTVLGTLLLYALRHVVMLNLPGIGKFLAQLIRIIQTELRAPRPAP